MLGSAPCKSAEWLRCHRFRCIAAIPTQWLLLPVLRVYGGAWGELAFMYIFALYMLCDMLLVPMAHLLLLHHIFCLIGHAIVIFWLPAGFETYFNGVIALELGSGAMNAFLMWQSRWSSAFYFIGMGASNCAVCTNESNRRIARSTEPISCDSK